MNKSLHIVIAPTNSCNISCDYCYNAHCSDEKHFIDILLVEEIIKKTFFEYDNVSFTWRGGEPLLLKRIFYRKIVKLQKKYSILYKTTFTNSLQSNGILLDKRWIRFLTKNKIGYGISFDGPCNDIHRGGGKKTLKAINLCKRIGAKVGCISVITKENIDLCELYDYLKPLVKGIKLSPCFKTKNTDFSIDVDEYIENLKKLFDKWIIDKHFFQIRPIENYIRYSLGIYNQVDCVNSGCLGKFIDIDSYGIVRICAHSDSPNIVLGNFRDFNSIEEMFGGNNFNAILFQMIQMREKCKQNCEYFHFCRGGCCVEKLFQVKRSESFNCKVVKEVYPYIDKKIKSIISNSEDLGKYNPAFVQMILEAIAIKPINFYSNILKNSNNLKICNVMKNMFV